MYLLNRMRNNLKMLSVFFQAHWSREHIRGYVKDGEIVTNNKIVGGWEKADLM